MKRIAALTLSVLLAGCTVSHVQKNNPTDAFKEHDRDRAGHNAVVGVGAPVSVQTMRANATFSMRGSQDLGAVMKRLAGTYNMGVRYGDGVRMNQLKDILISELDFNESRSYIEDVYGVQIIREGERRLLVLPSASAPRVGSFAPGLNVTLAQAVRGLSDLCGFNMVITENKQKLATTLVTANLQEITCHEAFDALLTPQGLSLVDEGSYYTISGFPTRNWRINLYEPERSESQQLTYQSQFGGESSEGSSSQSVGGSANMSISVERNLFDDLEKDLTELLDKSCEEAKSAASSAGVAVLNPNAGIAPLPSVATPDAGGDTVCGYVRVNKSVGLVQMRAPHKVLEHAEQLIKQIEDIASRRLMVEARVLAVTRDNNFNKFGNLTTDDLAGISGSNNAAPGDQLTLALSNSGSVASQLTNLLNSANITFKTGSLDAVVGIAERFGTTYQLMKPTMEVMDRQRATLIDGFNQIYFEVDTTTDTTTGGSVTNEDVNIKTQFVGLQFSVVAQVADEGEPHTVQLQLPITEILEFVDIPGSGGKAPVVSTRLIDQKVRVRDGEIKVIGGLTKTVARDTRSGTPLIGNIPAVGELAKSEDIDYEQVEFVVLLQVKRLQ